jgi:Domain of Unknown Function (DUF928)
MTRKPFFVIPLTPVQLFTPKRLRRIGWAAILSLGLWGMSHSMAIAQVLFEPPTGEDEPARTAGAATRGVRCMEANQEMIALKPSGKIGLTLADHPAVWISLPRTTAENIVLSVLTETGKVVYENLTFPVSDTGGLIALQLPEEEPPLEIGTRYQWIAELECNPNNSSGNPSVLGWVKRVAPDAQIEAELYAAEHPLDKAEVYARHGIWYETLTLVAQQRQANPEDAQVMAAWRSLLEWVENPPTPQTSSPSGGHP